MNARIVNIVLGAWLFISAFLWPHSQGALTNTWMVGLLAALFAGWSAYWQTARFVNTALAVWLFFSTFATAHNAATLWNNLAVAVAMFAASIIPPTEAPRPWFRAPPPRRPTTV